jgi:hypothetical protein
MKYDEEAEERIMLPPENIANKPPCNDSGNNNTKSGMIKYNDYYEWMGNAKEVRPITVMENLQWSTMSCFNRFLWWIKTFIQMITLTILSLRTDRLLDWNGYLKYHWKHYLGRMAPRILFKI